MVIALRKTILAEGCKASPTHNIIIKKIRSTFHKTVNVEAGISKLFAVYIPDLKLERYTIAGS